MFLLVVHRGGLRNLRVLPRSVGEASKPSPRRWHQLSPRSKQRAPTSERQSERPTLRRSHAAFPCHSGGAVATSPRNGAQHELAPASGQTGGLCFSKLGILLGSAAVLPSLLGAWRRMGRGRCCEGARSRAQQPAADDAPPWRRRAKGQLARKRRHTGPQIPSNTRIFQICSGSISVISFWLVPRLTTTSRTSGQLQPRQPEADTLAGSRPKGHPSLANLIQTWPDLGQIRV